MSASSTVHKGFIVYLVWNALRFTGVGYMVYQANHCNVEKELNPIINDCCKCYMVSKNPGNYSNLDAHARFDLSYCIPFCVDCNYCEAHPNAIISESKCPASNYTEPNTWWGFKYGPFFNPLLKERTGCTKDSMSITSMHYFVKSYKSYGHWAVGIGSTYAAANLVVAGAFHSKSEHMAIIVFIYNAVVAELELYWLFKPYQYYRITTEYEEEEIDCEIDSISETQEQIISALLWITFGLLGLQLIYIFILCFFCCKRCCSLDQRERVNSFHYDTMTDPESGRIKRCRCTCKKCSCKCDWGWYLLYGHVIVGIIVLCMMIAFVGILIWVFTVMIQANDKENQCEKDVFTIVVSGLLFMSTWDMLIFPFCRKRTAGYFWDIFKDKVAAISSSKSLSVVGVDDNNLINVHNVDDHDDEDRTN